jgi:hypothetical protein
MVTKRFSEENAEYISSLFTTIEIDSKRKKSFKEVANENECVSLDVFIDELKASVNEYFENAQSSCN